MPAPRSITYGDLRTQGDECAKLAPIRQAIEDFYAGGYQLAGNAKNYLPKLVGEHARRYDDRVKSGGYINYFAQITDYYASALFTSELAIRPASDADDPKTPGGEPVPEVYEEFAKNADGHGTSLTEVLHALVISTLKNGSAWLHLEMPEAEDVASRAEEEERGLAVPYVFEVPHEQVLDYDRDDDGELVYLVLHQAKTLKGPPGERRGQIRETFKIWQHDEETERVSWATYQVDYDPRKKPKDNDEIPLLAEGVVTFRCIPLLLLEFPTGLWLGNKLVGLAKEHWQRRVTLNAAENRSMVAIPVAKLGPEMSAPGEPMPSDAQQDPNRGVDPVAAFHSKGYEVIGRDDSIEFAEPAGNCYELVAKRIEELKDEMFRVAHQMAASVSMNAGNAKRSGVSKQEDRAAEALVLGAIGRVVRHFAVHIYTDIAEARGEDVNWQAHGLDSYESADRDEVLAEAIALDQVQIPSVTFRKTHKKQIAAKLLIGCDPETLTQISNEIDDGVDQEEEMRQLEHDAEKDRIENPPPPVMPGMPGMAKPKGNPAQATP